MAVQAHLPLYTFSPDFRNRVMASSVVADEPQMFEDHNRNLFCGKCSDVKASGLAKNCDNGGTAFGNDPQKSELTCNASASRKRARGDAADQLNANLDALFHRPPKTPAIAMQAQPPCFTGSVVPDEFISFAGHQMMQSRFLQSAHASTSGRFTIAVTSSPSILAQDIVSDIYHQNLDIDAFVRFQNERLRLRLEEARKRHCQELLASIENAIAKRLSDKDTELNNARRRNAELQEKVRQMSAENHIWFTVANNNETIISGLRASLEQVLLQNAAANEAGGSPAGCVVDTREGYGDSEVDASMPIEDTHSCCLEDKASADVFGNGTEVRRGHGRGTACKVCGESDVCVLLLPCRHLCLCKSCESKEDTCPICSSTRKASLQIFLS